MKKNLRLFFVTAIVAGFAMYSCTKEFTDSGTSSVQNPATMLSVSDAKLFFEQNYRALPMSRSSSVKTDSSAVLRLHTGDYTPLWDQALSVADEFVTAVDAPIVAEQQYGAWIKVPNRLYAAWVQTPQRLVVIKNRETEEMTTFIATQVPEPHFYHSLKQSNHSHVDCNFTGVVIFKSLEGQIHQVAKYKDGKVTINVHLQDSDTPSDILVSQANEILKNILIKPVILQTARNGTEPDPWLPGGGQTILCNKCGQYHAANAVCPVPVEYCNICHSQGHLDSECPYKRCPVCNGVGVCFCCSTCHKYPCECFTEPDPDPNICPDCGQYTCRCPKCDICGKKLKDCTGHGGGTTTDPTDPTNPQTPEKVAPKAYKLFKNSSSDINFWKNLESMIDSMIVHCMGGMLYDGILTKLGNSQIPFILDTSMPGSGKLVNNDDNTQSVVLGSMESHLLVHELFHFYQCRAIDVPTINKSALNIEIEARLAQHRFVTSQPNYESTNYHKKFTRSRYLRQIDQLNVFFDKK